MFSGSTTMGLHIHHMHVKSDGAPHNKLVWWKTLCRRTIFILSRPSGSMRANGEIQWEIKQKHTEILHFMFVILDTIGNCPYMQGDKGPIWDEKDKGGPLMGFRRPKNSGSDNPNIKTVTIPCPSFFFWFISRDFFTPPCLKPLSSWPRVMHGHAMNVAMCQCNKLTRFVL